ncbi:MAG: hypothetical protein FWE44_06830 [Defluviitaleaceae bacterium]|nr:hypothetical protein [Defluviitaleaceae bacterium]
MRKFFTLFFLFGIIFALSACAGEDFFVQPINFGDVEVQASVQDKPQEIVFLELRFELANHTLAKHEPEHGVLLGAYIKRDFAMNNIEDFQRYLGINHSIFSYTMHLGDEYPLRWVLENIANFSAPHITLLPPQYGEKFDIELIEEFAAQAGIFDTPIFVQLYPIWQGHNFILAEYIDFFKKASGIFEIYAPNVALVWGVDGQSVEQSTIFFPSEDIVDWVQITVYNEIDEDGNFDCFFKILEPFYFEYNGIAPIMVSVAVSHYSTANNRYFSLRAADKLEDIYERIITNFPRIRAVIYHNYNDIAGRGGMYRINSTSVLTRAYVDSVNNPQFLNSFQKSAVNMQVNTVVRTPYMAVMQGNEFFLPSQILPYFDGDIIVINSQNFVSMRDISEQLGMDFFVNFGEGFFMLKGFAENDKE